MFVLPTVLLGVILIDGSNHDDAETGDGPGPSAWSHATLSGLIRWVGGFR